MSLKRVKQQKGIPIKDIWDLWMYPLDDPFEDGCTGYQSDEEEEEFEQHQIYLNRIELSLSQAIKDGRLKLDLCSDVAGYEEIRKFYRIDEKTVMNFPSIKTAVVSIMENSEKIESKDCITDKGNRSKLYGSATKNSP